jgi:hypothetical protein
LVNSLHVSATNAKNQVKHGGHIIEVILAERQTPEILLALKKEIVALSRDRRWDLLIDASKARTSSAAVREEAAQFFATLPYHRFAIWGGTPPVNLAIKLLLDEHCKDKPVRIFRREADARAWLEESRQ